jgi:hypothetical protein
MSESSNENDSYFADPSSPPTRYPSSRLADEQGYIIRRLVHEDGTRPEYILPVGTAHGVWGMMKEVGRFQGEGWLSLWKGISNLCLSFSTLTAQFLARSVDFLYQRHAFGDHRTNGPERPAVDVLTNNISISSTSDLTPCRFPPNHRVDLISVGPDKNATHCSSLASPPSSIQRPDRCLLPDLAARRRTQGHLLPSTPVHPYGH